MTVMTPDQLTKQVLAAYAGTPDPRLRQLLTSLIGHLHAFAVETQLTRQEWLAGVNFLTATGQKCDDERQEFILLSDVLGFSSLVDLINAADGATESTVLGPFYVPGAPVRAMGEQLGRPEDGSPTLVRGRVTDPAGAPLDGASLDVWQSSQQRALRHPGSAAAAVQPARGLPDRARRRLPVPHGTAGQLPDPHRRPGRRSAARGRPP